MYDNNTKNIYGKTRNRSKKSNIDLEEFKKRLIHENMDITKFSKHFGIARTTIYGWSENGIPIYIEKIIELLEVKNRLRESIKIFNENNTKKIKDLYEINTDEPTRHKN